MEMERNKPKKEPKLREGKLGQRDTYNAMKIKDYSLPPYKDIFDTNKYPIIRKKIMEAMDDHNMKV